MFKIKYTFSALIQRFSDNQVTQNNALLSKPKVVFFKVFIDYLCCHCVLLQLQMGAMKTHSPVQVLAATL